MYSLFFNSPWTPVFIFFIFAAFLVLRYRKLHFVPGPPLASFTNLWRAYKQNTDSFTNVLIHLHNVYGPFVRIAPNTVSVSDTAAVSTIYSMRGEFEKADSYRPLRVSANGQVVGSIIDMQDEQMLSALKRAIGHAFARKNLLDYEPDVDATIATFIERVTQDREIDLFETLQRFQLDFLRKMAFSQEPTYLNTNEEVYPMSFHARDVHWQQWQPMPALEHLLFKPPLLRNYMSFTPPKWARMALSTLRSRQSGKDSPPREQKDLLDKYIEAGELHKDTISPDLILRVVSSTISAGFDTTAFTMTTMIYFLLKNPNTYSKLQHELEDAVASGQLSVPPTFVEAERLEYLNAVFKEAMRCYPFLMTLLERVVPAGGAIIAGKWFPGGTIVGCHPTLVHHDRACYGEDVDAFRPERWLTQDSEKRIAMERAALGFGSGKRICIGRHIADLEIKKMIPTLLLRFKLSFVDPTVKLEPDDIYTSFPKTIMVRLEKSS